MAATVSGSKTVTKDVSPTHTAAQLTTIFATAPENLTYGNLLFLFHCLQQKQGGLEPVAVIGPLFP